MAKIFDCGFIRAAVLNAAESCHPKQKSGRYQLFTEQFRDVEHIHIKDEFYFHRKLSDLISFVRKRKWHGDVRKQYLAFFSKQNWETLEDKEQSKHKLNHCTECNIKYLNKQQLFPDVSGKKKNNKLVLKDVTNTVKINAEIPITPYVKEAAKSILSTINTEWDRIYETSFTKTLTKIPECGITVTKTPNEKRAEQRKIQNKIKKSIEDTWSKDGKDVDILYGTRQSLSSYNKHRSNLYFESKANAVKRSTSKLYSFL